MTRSYSVRKICKALEITSSGYYAWLLGLSRKREARRNRLRVLIAAHFLESKMTYGPMRIHHDLKEENEPCSRNYVNRMMQEMGLKSIHKRKFKVTTDSNHDWETADNILDRNFQVKAINTVYTADITYIATLKGWLYLAVVDLSSRKVVGWALQDPMRTELILEALQMACSRRRPEKGVIHHSDQGSRYASFKYQSELLKMGMVSSMSRKGNYWDITPSESFFSTLKKELIYPQESFCSRAKAYWALFQYIEIFYNTKRKHSTLNYLSPANYELDLQKK
jgi:putative transposase